MTESHITLAARRAPASSRSAISRRAFSRCALRLAVPLALGALLSLATGSAWAQDPALAPAADPALAAPAEPGLGAIPAEPAVTPAEETSVAGTQWAPEPGETAWMLMASALVMLMAPGLALFYGGLVRSKNMLNTLLMTFGSMALMGVLWVLIGYSLAFGNSSLGGFVGDLSFAGFNGVAFDAPAGEGDPIPHALFAIFQGMFFILTPALISGSLVERMRFPTYLVFIALWGLLSYAPVCHWVWGGGLVTTLEETLFVGGVLDFAGGAVVHVNAGFAALAACMALGARRGYGKRPMLPHNLPFCLLGAALLWFGWFGFNAGSALNASEATLPFVTTQIAAATAMLVWMLLDYVTRKEFTALGAATGAVAGLVGITPACGFVTPGGAIFVGAITSAVCYGFVIMRARSSVDDSLDAFAVHGIGGFVGAVLTGIFAASVVGVEGGGLLEGNVRLFINQIVITSIVAIYSFVIAFILAKVLGAVMGLRSPEEVEERGLDLAQHGEEAYNTEASV